MRNMRRRQLQMFHASRFSGSIAPGSGNRLSSKQCHQHRSNLILRPKIKAGSTQTAVITTRSTHRPTTYDIHEFHSASACLESTPKCYTVSDHESSSTFDPKPNML